MTGVVTAPAERITSALANTDPLFAGLSHCTNSTPDARDPSQMIWG